MTHLFAKAAGGLAAATILVASAYAQTPAPAAGGPPVLALKLAPPQTGSSRLLVTSSAFSSGSDLDDRYTQNGAGMSPSLSWPKGPDGTQSYVVLVEDPGAPRPEPISHWVIYNIPSTSRGLPQNVPTDATLENGANQGTNIARKVGYIGPKPPAGQTHPYHFEVFALNTKLHLDPATADRNAVVSAMKNKVLASGDIVANYTGK
jgi:Raf kinase inhibitor-like YbhB/YbcL family protein